MEPARSSRHDRFGGNALNIALTTLELLHLSRINVDSNDSIADLDKPQHKRKSDIT